MALLALGGALSIDPRWAYPVRTVVVAAALLWCSRGVIGRLRPRRPWASVLIGAAVFLVWVAPDLLWPAYRQHWLFRNSLWGFSTAAAPAPAASLVFLFFRVSGAVLVAPVAEELFWRGWLMRWLITPEFWRTPLGTYAGKAFWITAALFASEHGAYWDVGLAAGVVYNAWMVRTRSLADCILAHAVTNAALAAHVLASGNWQYWR